MQITPKFAILNSFLVAAVSAAADISFCHGGAKGVCQDITLTSPEAACYSTVDAAVGTVDTIIANTPGVEYTLFTAAACAGTPSAVFGNGTNTLVAPLLNKVVSLSASIPTVWTSLGCFTDFAGSRTLAASSFANGTTMTIESCQAFCDSGAFGFAGVEYGSECYCDHSIQYPAVLDDATTCDMACAGNANQTCGGAGHISVFSSGKPLPTTPQAVDGPGATSWAYDGCFVDDSVGNRTLALHLLSASTGVVTPETCVTTCAAAGQTFAGLEYGSECWCGTAIQNEAAKVEDVECGQACASDPSFFCGDANRLNVWTVAAAETVPDEN